MAKKEPLLIVTLSFVVAIILLCATGCGSSGCCDFGCGSSADGCFGIEFISEDDSNVKGIACTSCYVDCGIAGASCDDLAFDFEIH
jgi:uncharacterized ferredoxin-like protein